MSKLTRSQHTFRIRNERHGTTGQVRPYLLPDGRYVLSSEQLHQLREDLCLGQSHRTCGLAGEWPTRVLHSGNLYLLDTTEPLERTTEPSVTAAMQQMQQEGLPWADRPLRREVPHLPASRHASLEGALDEYRRQRPFQREERLELDEALDHPPLDELPRASSLPGSDHIPVLTQSDVQVVHPARRVALRASSPLPQPTVLPQDYGRLSSGEPWRRDEGLPQRPPKACACQRTESLPAPGVRSYTCSGCGDEKRPSARLCDACLELEALEQYK